jgi:hypothetical protein
MEVFPNIVLNEERVCFKKKNPEIPSLKSYAISPNKSFWEIFPSKSLPVIAETNVSGDALLNLIDAKRDLLTNVQIQRGMKTVNFVKEGADCCQLDPLPACMQKNASSAIEYGEAVTDTIATWIKEGFAAGPFDTPPVDKFRVNCLMAIPQGSKVRPVLNGSLPEFKSLNSNVNPLKVEKVKMCSARCFSYSVIDAGDSSYIAKMDMLNAYKNIPCVPSEYRLQGFHWLGKYFIETRQIFGAKTAVFNFDVLGKTLLDATLVDCDIHRSLVHRQLDDVPVVVPRNKKAWLSVFISRYKSNCTKIGVGLAEDDPKMEKAYTCTQCGKVLGIWFNTVGLTWAYPEDKKMKLLSAIKMFVNSDKVTLLEMQKLMGRINDISLLAPFLKCYKGPLNGLLGWLQRNPNLTCKPSRQCVKDVLVWASFVLEDVKWKPISPRPMFPPLTYYSFTSDAAGFTNLTPINSKIGFGSIGLNPDGEVCMANQTFWPTELRYLCDSKGAKFGSKTLFLEIIGLLAPFLLVPDLIKGTHVILNVDNLGCYYGWMNRNVQGDICASIVIRTIVLISGFLSVYVHVNHLPRLSTWDAILCDRLSRSDTTSINDRKMLDNFKTEMPKNVMDWLKNPVEDWDLCYILLDYVKKIMKYKA